MPCLRIILTHRVCTTSTAAVPAAANCQLWPLSSVGTSFDGSPLSSDAAKCSLPQKREMQPQPPLALHFQGGKGSWAAVCVRSVKCKEVFGQNRKARCGVQVQASKEVLARAKQKGY